MATTSKKELVTIKPIKEETFTIRVIGDTPLIMHKWSEKAKKQLPAAPKDDDSGLKKKKDHATPIESFITSMYWATPMPTEYTEEAFCRAVNDGAKFGFPVTAFKKAAISSAYRNNWIENNVSLRGEFFIEADFVDDEGTELVEIHSDTPILREDLVRIGMGSPDLRWRGEFRNWYADLKIRYNKNGKYTQSDIINVVNAGGFYCGIGEWRVERDGQFGKFHVASDAEMK